MFKTLCDVLLFDENVEYWSPVEEANLTKLDTGDALRLALCYVGEVQRVLLIVGTVTNKMRVRQGWYRFWNKTWDRTKFSAKNSFHLPKSHGVSITELVEGNDSRCNLKSAEIGCVGDINRRANWHRNVNVTIKNSVD